MEPITPYVDALSASLPLILSDALVNFDPGTRETLETLIQFCTGASCPQRYKEHASSWDGGQTRFRSRLSKLEPGIGLKRTREDNDGEAGSSSGNADAITTTNGLSGPQKKQKLAAEEGADGEDAKILFTIYSLSVSAPVRKKVDILLTPDSLRFQQPTSGILEARVPLAQLTRAFLVSSLGKNRSRPQWAVTLLSADSVPGKKGAGDATDAVQVAFAVDKTVPGGKDGFKTSAGDGSSTQTHAKGADTLPILQAFLAHLSPHIEVHEALGSDASSSSSSPFASSAGEPYVEAYRGAKEGALAFLPRGILWAGVRPAEFFALEDLAPDADGEEASRGGVKTLSATGRTFSVFVRRRLPRTQEEEEEYEEDEVIEEEYEETEFAMIDGREMENVNSWIRRYRKQFGKALGAVGLDGAAKKDIKGKGKAKEDPQDVMAVDEDDSDASDEEYAAPSDSDGGEPSSDSEEEGEGGDSEGEAEESDEGDLEGEVEELDPAHHPLMRPGAMPKMSKAAMNAAVQMVMGDMVGSDEDELD